MNSQPRTATDDLALTRVTVREAMQLGLFECTADTDVPTLARIMAEKAIHCVVVDGVERNPHNWGIVTDLDLMRGLRSGTEGVTAGDLAVSELVAIKPAATLAEAIELMVEHATTHLIVASPDTGRPVGMLSTLDIARTVARRG